MKVIRHNSFVQSDCMKNEISDVKDIEYHSKRSLNPNQVWPFLISMSTVSGHLKESK